MRTQKTVGQSLVLAHPAEQQMFGLDVRGAVLTGFIPRKENCAARPFRYSVQTQVTRFSLSAGSGFRFLQHLQKRSVLQFQHAIGAFRQNSIVRSQDGGEPMCAVQALHQLENRDGVSFVQIPGRLVRQQQGRLFLPARGRSLRAVVRLRITPLRDDFSGLPNPLHWSHREEVSSASSYLRAAHQRAAWPRSPPP